MDSTASPRALTDVFISYSRADREFVRRLSIELENAGRGAWVDWEGIAPSAEWMAEIHSAIEAADSVVFVLSPESVSSTVCGLEIEHATNYKKRLIPVVARDCKAETVPEALGRLNWVLMRSEEEFPVGVAQLMEALDTDLDWVKLHTRTLVRASDWEAKGRDSSLLLRGKDLKETERWLSEAADHESPEPNSLQLEFVVESRRADTRRQRIVLVATVAALALATALAIWAFRERNVAQRQTQLSVAKNLLVEGQSERHDAELRILLAVESLQRLSKQGRANPESTEALDAVASLRARERGSLELDGDPGGIALSERGDRVAVWRGSRVVVRQTLGMSGGRELDAGGNVTAAAFDPLATKLAVGLDGVVRTYDLAPGNEAALTFECEGQPGLVRFDGMGRFLAAATTGGDGSERLCLWAVDAQDLLARVELPPAAGERPGRATAAFSSDSKFFAALMPIADNDWSAVLLETESGVEQRSWRLTASRPLIAFRGSTLVVAEHEAVWSWNAAEQREASRWNLDGRWRPLVLSADGRFLIVQLFSGTSFVMDDFSYSQIGLYEAAGGIELAQMPYAPLGFTPDGRFLITASSLLQIPTMATARVIPRSAQAASLLMSADSRAAVTLSEEHELTAWSLTEAPELVSVPLSPTIREPRAFGSRVGLAAFASGLDVQIIPLATPSRALQIRSAQAVKGLAFDDEGRYLLGVGEERLTFWELPELTLRLELAIDGDAAAAKECGLLDLPCRRAAERPWLIAVKPLFLGRGTRFIGWNGSAGLRIWTVPEGRLVHEERPAGAQRALLEAGSDLIIGHDDGRVTVLDTADWQTRFESTVHGGRIDRLVALNRTDLVAAVSSDVELDSYSGTPHHDSSKWSLTLFSLPSGERKETRADRGTLGPWSADGAYVAVQTSDEEIEIMRGIDGRRVRAAVALSKSVAQRARPLTFTSDERFLIVESETPITFGRAEPTLHVIDVDSGRATARMPERDYADESIRLDRSLPYPERFLADGTYDRVAAVVFKNADAYWAVRTGRAERELTVWEVTERGQLAHLLRTSVSSDLEPIGFVGGGRFLATGPGGLPTPEEAPAYGLGIWSVGLDERMRLACAATDGDLSTEDWAAFIGRFTGEKPGATCASFR